MAVPTYEQFIPHLLSVLGKHPDGIRTTDAFEAAADAVGLSAEDRAEVIPSGSQALYRNRIGWAHDSVKRVGWSSSPKFGVWQITAAGKAALPTRPTAADAKLDPRGGARPAPPNSRVHVKLAADVLPSSVQRNGAFGDIGGAK